MNGFESVSYEREKGKKPDRASSLFEAGKQWTISFSFFFLNIFPPKEKEHNQHHRRQVSDGSRDMEGIIRRLLRKYICKEIQKKSGVLPLSVVFKNPKFCDFGRGKKTMILWRK